MSGEEHTKRKVSFDQIPSRQKASLEAQLPKTSKVKGCSCLLIIIILLVILFNAIFSDSEDKSSTPEYTPPIQTQQPTQDDTKPVEQDKKSVQDLGRKL